MKSVSNFKKFLIVSVLVFISVVGGHAYSLACINTEVKKEIASEEITERINLLLLNISGYKNYQGSLRDQWRKKVDEINAILEQHPLLKAQIKHDFNAFTAAIEPEIENNPDPAHLVHLLETEQVYIAKLLAEVGLFSQNTSQQVINLKRISSGLQIILIFIALLLLLFYFYSFYSGYESSRIFLQNALKKMNTNEEIISFRKDTEDKVEGELRSQINELITGLHYKLEEKDKELKNKTELLSLLVKHLPLGLAVSTLNGKELKISNKKFSEFYSLESDPSEQGDNPISDINYNQKSFKEIFSPRGFHPTKISVEYKNQIVVDKKGDAKNLDIKRVPVPTQDLLISIIRNNTELRKKEKALGENKKFSEVIFNTDSVGFALLNKEGRFMKLNTRFCKIYGYSSKELIGQHFSILLPAENRAYQSKAFKMKLEAGTFGSTQQQEIKVIRKDGEIRNVLSSSEAYICNEVEGFIYSVIDITETTTEKDKMLAAIDGGGLGTWNINLQTGSNEVNEEWAKMLGYNKFEIYPNQEFFESLIHPEDQPAFQRAVQAILQGKQTSFYQEMRLKCKNGEYKWILDSGKVIKRDSKGQVLLMAGSHVDIDKVKKKELELLSTGDRLRRAQEMGMVGDWELETATETFSCSAMVYRIFGRRKNASALELKEITDQFHHSSALNFRRAINKLIEEKSSISMEGDIFLPDGKLKHLRIIAVPILDNKHAVSLWGSSRM